jgi:hypothetical protein
MAKGVLLVQSRPRSPEHTDDFHRWYDETHLPEMLQIDGIASARRLEALDGESFAAVYEVDDVDQAKAGLAAAQSSGRMSRPVGVQLDPPPTVQWFRERGAAEG